MTSDVLNIGQSPLGGRPPVKRIILTATLLHRGWEMDNTGWIVELEDGSIVAITTDHGGYYEWRREGALKTLEKTASSLQSICAALRIFP